MPDLTIVSGNTPVDAYLVFCLAFAAAATAASIWLINRCPRVLAYFINPDQEPPTDPRLCEWCESALTARIGKPCPACRREIAKHEPSTSDPWEMTR